MNPNMRRKERASSLQESEELLNKAPVGRLGMWCGDYPYVVPLNFAYSDGRIYFHCSRKGTKLDCISRNRKVCFEVDEFIGLKEGNKPCATSAFYRSAIAFGEARIVEDMKQKQDALRKIVSKYSHGDGYAFAEQELNRVAVVEIVVDHLTGKQNLAPTQ